MIWILIIIIIVLIVSFLNKESDKMDDASKYFTVGDKYNNEGDYDAAIEEYSKIIALYPKLYDAYNSRGFSKMKKGNIEGAVKDFNKSILIEPDTAKNYKAHDNLEIAQNKLKKEELPEFLQIYNDGVEALRNNNYSKAVICFSKSIELESDNTKNRNSYLKLEIAKEQLHNQKFNNLEDKQKGLLSNGLKNLQDGQLDNALESFFKALDIKESDVVLFNIGLCYEQMGDTDKAFYYINETLKNNKNHIEALALRAIILFSYKKYNEAKRDLIRFKELAPHDSNEMANNILKEIEKEEAKNKMDKAVKLLFMKHPVLARMLQVGATEEEIAKYLEQHPDATPYFMSMFKK